MFAASPAVKPQTLARGRARGRPGEPVGSDPSLDSSYGGWDKSLRGMRRHTQVWGASGRTQDPRFGLEKSLTRWKPGGCGSLLTPGAGRPGCSSSWREVPTPSPLWSGTSVRWAHGERRQTVSCSAAATHPTPAYPSSSPPGAEGPRKPGALRPACLGGATSPGGAGPAPRAGRHTHHLSMVDPFLLFPRGYSSRQMKTPATLTCR